ncbi:hypothetical protein Tco_1051200 [Tanacetum coccineum]
MLEFSLPMLITKKEICFSGGNLFQVAARKLLQKLGNAFATLSIFLIRVDDVCCISNRTTSEHVGRIRCKWYIFDGDEFESILKYLNVLRDGEEGENQLSLCVLAMKAALDLGSDGEAEKDLKDSVGCQVPETINVVSCDSYTVNDDVTSKRQREHRSDYGLVCGLKNLVCLSDPGILGF